MEGRIVDQRDPLLLRQATDHLRADHDDIFRFSRLSPVSPLEENQMNRPHNVSSSSFTESEITPRTTDATWLPYMLRWYFFLIPTALAATLCLVVSLLLWHSRQHHGLGNDNGSSALLFGWRFTPTIIAVLYVQQIVMLFEDIKKTEPFARLATPAGADAHSSILRAPRQWWFCLSDGLSKGKNGGRRSWALVIATCLYIIAVFGISPLSASILLSTQVFVPSKVQFNRMLPVMEAELPLKAGRETYFRTFGNLLQDVTTSAWLPDSYIVMPFFPANTDLNLGPVLNRTVQKWRAETTVFKNEFECTPFEVTKREPHVKVEFEGKGRFRTMYEYHNLTLGMETLDGCVYELDTRDSWIGSGGALWTSLHPQSRYDVYGEYRVNISQECKDRELLLATSPIWIEPGYNRNPNMTRPATLLSNHTMQAHLCASTPYMARIPVTMLISSSKSTAEVDDAEFRRRRQRVPSSFLNHKSLQQQYLNANWTKFMSQSSPEVFGIGELAGPSSLLGAWYGFNATVMSQAVDLPEQAAHIRERFFGELLMSSFTNRATTEQQDTEGELTIPQRRVVVVTEAAIALASLFCASFALLVTLFFLSRPTRRGLQLLENPWPTVGAAALIASGSLSKSPGAGISIKAETDLIGNRYSLRNGNLHQYEAPPLGEKESLKALSGLEKQDQRPLITRLRITTSLLSYLLALVVALAVLYHFARKSLLYQTAFVYQTKFALFNEEISTIAPYSIVPTLLAVCVGLWWDALDKSFRAMQPYLAMSQRRTKMSDGVCVSYHSSYWAWAAAKAARHRHWALFAVALGSTLCQVFIVSMSALFERTSAPMMNSVPIERTLEIQQVPTSQIIPGGYSAGVTGSTAVLKNLFKNVDTGWMYTAAIQLTLDGNEPTWSRDGWSFIPVDLSHVERRNIQKTGRNNTNNVEDGISLDSFGDNASLFLSMNVTLRTPAIRARLECSPVETVSNTSAWFRTDNLTNPFRWNITANPRDWETGWAADRVGGGNISTSLFAHPSSLSCCGNVTDDDDMVAVGYWSTPNSYEQPHSFKPWPVNITSKWVRGRGRDVYHVREQSGSQAFTFEEIAAPYLMFREPPKLQALTCAPIIESADSEVTVDRDTGNVLSHIIDGELQWETQAWTDPFVVHNGSEICRTKFPGTNWTNPISRNKCAFENVTTSYGVMFMSALISAAHLTSLEGVTFQDESAGWRVEDLDDMTFNIRDRDQGINVDFMTYAMYSLVGKNPDALLDVDTLTNSTQRVFTTFFQHFVSNSVSLKEGGFAYQPIGHMIEDPGPVYNVSWIPISTVKDRLPANYSNNYPRLNTARAANATVLTRIEVLHMNPTATWLSVAILLWLAATTILVAVIERKHVKRLNRGMDTLGNVLAWISGSDNLLQLVREKPIEQLMLEKGVWTKLGWFRDSKGVVRWGIEAEGGKGMRNVEWVNPPYEDMTIR